MNKEENLKCHINDKIFSLLSPVVILNNAAKPPLMNVLCKINPPERTVSTCSFSRDLK